MLCGGCWTRTNFCSDWIVPSGPDRPCIHVLRPGLFTTIQDLGRLGFQQFGVWVSGAMDRSALMVGNRLLGNPDRAAGMEVTVQGSGLALRTGLDAHDYRRRSFPLQLWLPLPMWTVIAMRRPPVTV